MEIGLVALFFAQSSIVALVGERMGPVPLQQDTTYPAITYQVISGPRVYTQDGPNGRTRWRVQINCYGTGYDSARAVRDAIEATLSGEHHVVFGSPPIAFHGVFIINERDAYESSVSIPGPPNLHRKIIDLEVWTSLTS